MSPLDHVWQILGIKRVTFRLICNCACKRMSIQDSFYPSKTWISPLQWDELISEGAFLDFFVNQCFHENFGPVMYHFFNAIRIKTSLKCIIFQKKSKNLAESIWPHCDIPWQSTTTRPAKVLQLCWLNSSSLTPLTLDFFSQV